MDDKAIVKLIYERNDRGLKALERKYGKRLLSICAGLVGREDGEECVNDTYLSVWESIPPERPENLFAFAAVIARRKAVSRFRRNSAAKRGGNTDILLSELEDCLPSREMAERRFDNGETVSMINKWLGGLKPRERRLFILRYFGGENIGSIANRMCMTPSAVRTALSRLRERLKQYLEKGGIEI